LRIGLHDNGIQKRDFKFSFLTDIMSYSTTQGLSARHEIEEDQGLERFEEVGLSEDTCSESDRGRQREVGILSGGGWFQGQGKRGNAERWDDLHYNTGMEEEKRALKRGTHK